MSEELRPCPFCGKEPHIDANYFLYGCRNKDCIADSTNYEPTIGFFEDWNTRPIEDALQARIAELEAAQCWTPVSEGLPELDQDVFAVVDGELDRGHFYQQWDGEVFFSSDEKGAMMVATHWMPLPEPPEVK